MLESQTRNTKVASSSLGPAGIVGGGSECTGFGALLKSTSVVVLRVERTLCVCVCVCVCSLLCVCVVLWVLFCNCSSKLFFVFNY